MGSRGRESYGKAGREAASAVDAIASLVDGFDPDVTGARDAVDLVEVFSRLEHLASAGVALAARRVAHDSRSRDVGPPDLVLLPGHPADEAPRPEPDTTRQGDLFDTG
jgi:hypothetical protein